MLHRVGHFTAKNVPGGWGISSHDNVENPSPLFPEIEGVGVTIDYCIIEPCESTVLAEKISSDREACL